ncbi:MAG: hypothetical protein IT371_08325 [Deltaproteobacteria bacterium]|nr:hypothetical protein [Deltaproteobacteria bacterium]
MVLGLALALCAATISEARAADGPQRKTRRWRNQYGFGSHSVVTDADGKVVWESRDRRLTRGRVDSLTITSTGVKRKQTGWDLGAVRIYHSVKSDPETGKTTWTRTIRLKNGLERTFGDVSWASKDELGGARIYTMPVGYTIPIGLYFLGRIAARAATPVVTEGNGLRIRLEPAGDTPGWKRTDAPDEAEARSRALGALYHRNSGALRKGETAVDVLDGMKITMTKHHGS